jgi:O-antigen ligase
MEIVRDRLVPESITEYGNPHNIFIEALSSRGIIGLLAVLALIGFPLYLAVAAGSKPETRTYTTLVFCVSFAFIISGQTDTLVIIRGVFASYLIMVGLSLAVILRPVISDTAGAR